jgi:hypothetical protein
MRAGQRPPRLRRARAALVAGVVRSMHAKRTSPIWMRRTDEYPTRIVVFPTPQGGRYG